MDRTHPRHSPRSSLTRKRNGVGDKEDAGAGRNGEGRIRQKSFPSRKKVRQLNEYDFVEKLAAEYG